MSISGGPRLSPTPPHHQSAGGSILRVDVGLQNHLLTRCDDKKALNEFSS